MIKNVYGSSCKVPVILVRYYLDLNFFRHILEKSNTKFHENPSSGAKLLQSEGRMDRRTERRDEANGTFWSHHSTEPYCQQQLLNSNILCIAISLFNLEF